MARRQTPPQYLYARTRAEVRDKYRKAQRALEEGRSLGDDRQKVGQYLQWWLTKALPGTVRETTVVSYRGALYSNVIPHIGHIRLSKLTAQHIQEMLAAIQDKGLSARTAKYAHAVLRRALSPDCESCGYPVQGAGLGLMVGV